MDWEAYDLLDRVFNSGLFDVADEGTEDAQLLDDLEDYLHAHDPDNREDFAAEN